MKEESINLRFKAGSSDKVYNAALLDVSSEKKSNEWDVVFSYGRFGSALTSGSKTSKSVAYESAKKIYDKLVNEKIQKGYKIENGGSGVQMAASMANNGRDTGWIPQLLNEISEEEIETYLISPEWCAQEKFDGRNRLLIKKGDSIIGGNRKGLEVAISDGIRREMEDINDCVLSGEAIDEHIMCFDIISAKGFSYRERISMLNSILTDAKYIRKIYTAWSEKEKRTLLAKLKRDNAEGIVFKNIMAHYTPGKPASVGSMLKFKFVSTASVIAGDVNKGKRSVEMWVHDKAQLVNVGNVTIYPNQNIPKRGEILEIKYLYAFPGGSLFQPVLIEIRDDLDEKNCTINQLKYKREE